MYKIYADSCCDLPLEVIEKINIGIIPLRYTIDGVEHVDDRKDDSIFVDFYDKMKKGAMTSTSQPTPEELNELFKDLRRRERESSILHCRLPLAVLTILLA